MEIKFNIILTMHINICQYRTKLPHAPKVKIMNLLTITYKCTCIGKLIGAAGMGRWTYWPRFIHILERLVQLTHRFICRASNFSLYMQPFSVNIWNVYWMLHRVVPVIRGRAIFKCNSLDSSWILLGLLYHTVTSWTIIFHDTVKHEYFMNSYIWPFKWH